MAKSRTAHAAVDALPDDLMTAEEAATLLSVEIKTIQNWTYQRKIPFYQVNGRMRLISRADLTRMVKRVEAIN